MNNLCLIHQKYNNFFCANSTCQTKRIICQTCKQKQHRKHVCVAFDQLDNITTNLQPNKTNISASIQRVFNIITYFKKNCQQKSQAILNVKNKLYHIFSSSLQNLSLLLKGLLSSHCQQKCQNISQLNSIAELLRFINLPEVQGGDQLSDILEMVSDKAENIIDNWNTKIDNSFSEFNYQIDNLIMSHWSSLYKQKIQQMERLRKITTINSFKSASSINTTKQQKQKINQSSNIKRLNKEGTKMQNLTEFKEIKTYQIQKDVKLKIQHQQPEKNKKISKNLILNEINNFLERARQNNLTQLIIEGPNEFDLQCLKKITELCPKLKKFAFQTCLILDSDYLDSYKKQVFFNQELMLIKQSNSPFINQQFFDYLGKLFQLENLQIDNPTKFTNKQIRIRNKSIKYLTIGDYKTERRYKISDFLRKTISCLNPLISLHLFNFEYGKDSFLKIIIHNHRDSLINLWLKNWDIIQEETFLEIKKTKIQQLILQNIEIINHSIYLPQVIKTFLLQKCVIYSKQVLIGLNKAKYLINFSISHTKFYENKTIGDNLIYILSSITPCNLQYLNVEGCISVTSQSLDLIQKMPKLKQLCISQTNIKLNFLAKQPWLKQLQQLVINQLKCSLQTNQDGKIMEHILEKSSNLKTISLTFSEQLTSIYQRSYNRLQNICIEVQKPNQYLKCLKQFLADLKQKKKNINIKKKCVEIKK